MNVEYLEQFLAHSKFEVLALSFISMTAWGGRPSMMLSFSWAFGNTFLLVTKYEKKAML